MEEVVVCMGLAGCISTLKYNWEFLLEVSENEVVLQFALLLQGEVEALNGCETEIEQEGL